MSPTQPVDAPEAPTVVTGWISGTNIVHLDVDTCPGLDRMRQFDHDPREKFTAAEVADVLDLVDYRHDGTFSTLCRLCALEPVVNAILETHAGDAQSARHFATFVVKRPAGTGPRRKVRRSDADDTERRSVLYQQAAQRLRRIAAVADLEVTMTTNGPAAYGFLPDVCLDKLRRVVHTEVQYTVSTMPTVEVVATFWSLLVSPDQTPVASGTGAMSDPWYVAELICGVPA